MSKIRVMFVGHGPSNLPEDHVVNVFHFFRGGAYADNVVSTVEAVDDFYNVAYSGNKVSQYLSPWIQRDAEFRAYDLEESPPRVPTVFPFSMTAAESNSGLPEEVACCLSLLGVVPPAMTVHRRGRLYIGPLCTTAGNIANTTVPARPSATFVQTLGLAAAALVTANVGWSVRTVTGGGGLSPGGMTLIANGYTDNAFDTQRRRGPRTTTRTVWPVG